MTKKKTYKQILDGLKLPADTPQSLNCKMCGNPLTLLKVNPYVCFWIHTSEEQRRTCGEANKIMGKPVVATSHNWTAARTIEMWHSCGLVNKH